MVFFDASKTVGRIEAASIARDTWNFFVNATTGKLSQAQIDQIRSEAATQIFKAGGSALDELRAQEEITKILLSQPAGIDLSGGGKITSYLQAGALVFALGFGLLFAYKVTK